MGDGIGSSGCLICMGKKRVLVGLSYPPKSTIGVKGEYEPCPSCQPGPHSFYAQRTMQILIETRAKRLALTDGGKDE